MGLQVRVRHSLGDRLIELPDRTIDNPITIGRAAGVEVQVPSVSVAPRHCVLFRFDGHWAVQDVAATSGTYVNGEHVGDPVMLQIGDVISIGAEASAPTIEIDPGAAAEGRTGWAGDEAVGSAHAAPKAYAAGYASGHAASFPAAVPGAQRSAYGNTGGFAATTRAPAAAAVPLQWAEAHDAASGDEIDLGAAVATTASEVGYRSPRRRPKPGTPTAAIVGGILAVIAIIGVTIWLVELRSTPEAIVIAHPAPAAVQTPQPAAGPVKMFGNDSLASPPSGSGQATPPVIPSTPVSANAPSDTSSGDVRSADGHDPSAAQASAAPTPSPRQVASATPDMSSSAGTSAAPATSPATAPPAPSTPTPLAAEDWQEMQKVHESASDPALAIFRLNAFLKQHADQHPDEIKKFMDDKFDSLWWDRIEQLFRKRDRLVVDIKKKQDEIWDENNPAEKKREQGEKDALTKTQAMTKEMLTVKMGYTDEKPPDPSGLAAARDKRDANKYTEWKRVTLNSIVINKGKTEWAADE